MTLDNAIFRTVMDCADQFSSIKMINILYYNLFNVWAYKSYDILDTTIIDESRAWNDNPVDKEDDIHIDLEKFHDNIIKKGYIRCELDYDDIYVNTNKNIVLMLTERYIKCVCNYKADDEVLKEIQDCIELVDVNKTKVDIGILVQRNGNFYIEDTEIDIMDIDVEKTYNDDIPIEAIDDFIANERNGLMLLYGEPGTGKTTYIRYLIQNHEDKKFVILDSNLLYNITSHSLLNVFIDRKNIIYIIEDCEKLLVSRDNEPNPIISAFLNMTDGILSNVINCKFICTFNTDLSNIDDAIKRKGRMKLKYEFKKLACDKCKKIESSVNESMTIADLIHIKKENDFSKKSKQKIGFIA